MSAYSNSTYASEPDDDGYEEPEPTPALLGTCDLCGQDMILTEDDCWHPHYVDLACPPEPPDPTMSTPESFAAWQEFYAGGLKTGRPGREHWRPLE